MERILPGLHATPPMSPDFAPQSSVRAYLVQRPAGNVLLYASDRVSVADEAVRALGGIDRVYLSHWHEAGFGAGGIGAPVHVAEADRARAEEHAPIAGTFRGRQALDEAIEFIPMPGHTPGSTAFLVEAGDGSRCLFTGDTLWFAPKGWKVAILPESDRAAYLGSLAMLRGLDFDVLIPSFAPSGAPFTQRLTRDKWHAGVDALVARIEAGRDF